LPHANPCLFWWFFGIKKIISSVNSNNLYIFLVRFDIKKWKEKEKENTGTCYNPTEKSGGFFKLSIFGE
jgi:hypothetical protein